MSIYKSRKDSTFIEKQTCTIYDPSGVEQIPKLFSKKRKI
jgi:hypothetical protein